VLLNCDKRVIKTYNSAGYSWAKGEHTRKSEVGLFPPVWDSNLIEEGVLAAYWIAEV
jgi:hypothetical protein